MTDAEIKNALEWHSNDETHCSGCPYEEHSVTHYCVDIVIQDALDLINRQQAEIERLQGKVEMYEEERKYHFEMSRQAIAEAIKGFAERLKKQMKNLTRWQAGSHTYYVIGTEFIDNLVKEMVGEAQ